MKKDEHLKYAKQCEFENSLDLIRLKYYSMPKYSPNEVDISTNFCGIDFKYPIFFNSMTGGTEKGDIINKKLESISKKMGLFMFSGSYSPNLEGECSYFPMNMGSNIGADKNLEQMKKVIEKTNPKILQIHLNPIQEFMAIDGDTNFSEWQKNIKDALENIKIPIIIKETGYGMNSEMIGEFVKLGAKTIDISGKGGVNFSFIEDKRSGKQRQYLYELGYTTYESLKNSEEFMDRVEIIASGGIKTPMDVVKALSMGAKACGISSAILKIIDKPEEKIIELIQIWIEEIKCIVSITNSKNLEELKGKWEEKC